MYYNSREPLHIILIVFNRCFVGEEGKMVENEAKYQRRLKHQFGLVQGSGEFRLATNSSKWRVQIRCGPLMKNFHYDQRDLSNNTSHA